MEGATNTVENPWIIKGHNIHGIKCIHRLASFSFQGKHIGSIRVKFNRDGNGYLHDALFADGYTYAVYPSNMPEPN